MTFFLSSSSLARTISCISISSFCRFSSSIRARIRLRSSSAFRAKAISCSSRSRRWAIRSASSACSLVRKGETLGSNALVKCALRARAEVGPISEIGRSSSTGVEGPWCRERTVSAGELEEPRSRVCERWGWSATKATKGYVVVPSFCAADINN